MAILALNAGSSSLKFALFDGAEGAARWRGKVDLLRAELCIDGGDEPRRLAVAAPLALDAACVQVFAELVARGEPPPHAVVHRVVHGGDRFVAPVPIDAALVQALAELTPLAPLHQPSSLAAIAAARAHFAQARQFACFDTAFHAHWPDASRRLALPRRLHELGVRRYGFHGLAHQHAAATLAAACPTARRAVVAHLGSGASLCALQDFCSIDASMGFSTLDGLPMATRCGALDPGVVLHLLGAHGMSPAAVESLLYRESGLLGVSGISGDLRVLLAHDSAAAREAVGLFVHHVVRGIGAMAATLGGLDALVFSGGIGQHAPAVRSAVCARLGFLGVHIDADANDRHAQRIEALGSQVAVQVVTCDEELVMAREVMALT